MTQPESGFSGLTRDQAIAANLENLGVKKKEGSIFSETVKTQIDEFIKKLKAVESFSLLVTRGPRLPQPLQVLGRADELSGIIGYKNGDIQSFISAINSGEISGLVISYNPHEMSDEETTVTFTKV